MTGMSSLSSYERNGYKISGISFGSRGMQVRTVKASTPKKIKPRYNYKLLSSAILRAKTPGSAAQAAMQAKRKLGELLRNAGMGDNGEPDLKAAIIHIKKMELIAKKKKQHLEQEQMAERGQTPYPEENSEEAIDKNGISDIEDAIEQEEAQLEEEMKRMEQEMSREMLEELTELAEELAKCEEEMLSEEMPGLEGFENVSDMSPEDVKTLKRKHRSDEWCDITKADMDFLKAKFYRLQQEKAVAGLKGAFSQGESTSNVNYYSADSTVDVSVDAGMDMEADFCDVGSMIDMSV